MDWVKLHTQALKWVTYHGWARHHGRQFCEDFAQEVCLDFLKSGKARPFRRIFIDFLRKELGNWRTLKGKERARKGDNVEEEDVDSDRPGFADLINLKTDLNMLAAKLSSREKRILFQHLVEEEAQPLIAEREGVSQVRIFQIIKEARAKLRGRAWATRYCESMERKA
jgi:RNA polymerase sigma factor (sigma-70 family)